MAAIWKSPIYQGVLKSAAASVALGNHATAEEAITAFGISPLLEQKQQKNRRRYACPSCGIWVIAQTLQDIRTAPQSFKNNLKNTNADFICTSCVEMLEGKKIDLGGGQIFDRALLKEWQGAPKPHVDKWKAYINKQIDKYADSAINDPRKAHKGGFGNRPKHVIL